MIDVVLLLIIFFTMTSTFARIEQKMLDLPRQPGDPGKAALPVAMFVDMDRDGSLSITGTGKTQGEVVELARAESARAGGGLDLVVRAHRLAPAVHLNRLAEALAAAGVRHWKLATSLDRSAGGGEGGAP